MPDASARAVIGEIVRVLAPAGHLLVVEETDPRLEAGDAGRRISATPAAGRSPGTWRALRR